ncbi:hypothetical protein B0H14DRAFT_2881093, partial [Mycena olivaceomarginata]
MFVSLMVTFVSLMAIFVRAHRTFDRLYGTTGASSSPTGADSLTLSQLIFTCTAPARIGCTATSAAPTRRDGMGSGEGNHD